VDYLNIARKIFEGTRHQASEEEVSDLAKNMTFLEARGLDKLNRRLINGGRKIWDTFSEHNFASMLISRHDSKIPISYEPEGLEHPPDFKVVLEGTTYWIQMKRLSDLERENRQNKIFQKIKKAARTIKIDLFFNCDLSDAFSEDDISDLMDFITRHAIPLQVDKEYFFPTTENSKAKVSFWAPNKTSLSGLTLGSLGDMDMIEVTNLARDQIRNSLVNATRAFKWEMDDHTINLVAMDADKQEDIDLCNAVFGAEFYRFYGKEGKWGRKNNGFFTLSDVSYKLAGVIATKRKKQKPISDCFSMLFINGHFKDRLVSLHKLLSFDKVVHFNMRPGGKGNFDPT
jgi:hypothetical protein